MYAKSSYVRIDTYTIHCLLDLVHDLLLHLVALLEQVNDLGLARRDLSISVKELACSLHEAMNVSR